MPLAAIASTAPAAGALLPLQHKRPQTIKSNYTEEAKAGTKQEIQDNTTCWVQKAFQLAQQHGHDVVASWDNASMHTFKVSQVGLTQAQHLVLPPHSPDLHQIIEHCFARLKQELVVKLYHLGWDNVTPEVVAREVLELCEAEHGTVASAAVIKADLAHLPRLYRVLSTPKGQYVFDGSRWVQGSGGDWPPKGYR